MNATVIHVAEFAKPAFLLCLGFFCSGIMVGIFSFGFFAMVLAACESDYPDRDALR